MPTVPEWLTIPCPLCAAKHVYQLQVDRSLVANYVQIVPDDQTTEKRFTRLFTCPDKKTRFQAEIALEEHPGMKIQDVRILDE